MFNPFLSGASRNLTTHAITHLSQSEREGVCKNAQDTSFIITRILNIDCGKFSFIENNQSDAENNKA